MDEKAQPAVHRPRVPQPQLGQEEWAGEKQGPGARLHLPLHAGAHPLLCTNSLPFPPFLSFLPVQFLPLSTTPLSLSLLPFSLLLVLFPSFTSPLCTFSLPHLFLPSLHYSLPPQHSFLCPPKYKGTHILSFIPYFYYTLSVFRKSTDA